MLKAQKKQTSWKTFLQKKLSRNKHQVWEKARKGGRILRKKHGQQDEKEQKALEVEELENACLRKQRKEERAAKRKEKAMRAPSTAQTSAKRIVCVARKRLAHPQHSSSLSSHHALSSSSHLAPSDAEDNQPIPLSTPAVHDWVAVAYDNGWYPGHVVSIHDADTYVVNFLHPTSLANNFWYPPRKDEVAVTMPFIFACPLDPPRPTSGG